MSAVRRGLVSVVGVAALATGLLLPSTVASAGTALTDPLVASQTDIDEAFAAIIRASGLQTEEVCLDLTNAVGSTHVLESTASDETLACAAPDGAPAGRAAQAAGQLAPGERPCRDEIVFFPGADAGGAAINDAKGILSNPAWAKLTYLSGPDKQTAGTRSGWYKVGGYHTYAAGKCFPDPKPRGVECDEYPFYSTVEGGPGSRLEEVPRDENQAEARALNSMYQDTQCQFVSGQTKFFVVPVAVPITIPQPDPALAVTNATTTIYAGPPSGHVCGTNGGGVQIN